MIPIKVGVEGDSNVLSLCDYGNYSKIPRIWLNKDQNCPKKVDLYVLAVSKNAISGEKNISEIYLLQLKDK